MNIAARALVTAAALAAAVLSTGGTQVAVAGNIGWPTAPAAGGHTDAIGWPAAAAVTTASTDSIGWPQVAEATTTDSIGWPQVVQATATTTDSIGWPQVAAV
jgi:hypothetical protein